MPKDTFRKSATEKDSAHGNTSAGKTSILVFDYDETLTMGDEVVPSLTQKALREVYERKLAILGIVSGREISFLKAADDSIGNLFSFLVAENGAVWYFSDEDELTIEGKEWSQKAHAAFSGVTFPIKFCDVVVQSKRVYTKEITEILKHSNLEAKIVPNRDSVMICPPNVDKGMGVARAVSHYGATSRIFLTCFGDGENDLALFGPADVRVAVSNAVPQLKEIADVVTEKEGGLGVEEYLRKNILH